MSVTGLGWDLEFKEGYPAFVESLRWRHWAYQAVLCLPPAILAVGAAMGLAHLWRHRRAGLETRRSPLSMLAAVAILVPVAFALMGIRTSPTYLPVWYPLPFALMGWAAVRLMRRSGPARRNWLAVVLLAGLIVQLAFFSEQLIYMRSRGGVPGSLIERSLGGAEADVASAAGSISTADVYLLYEGNSPIQDEAAAWLFRHARWSGDVPGTTLLRFAWGSGRGGPVVTITTLPADAAPPPGAFRVRPWTGPQQQGGRIVP